MKNILLFLFPFLFSGSDGYIIEMVSISEEGRPDMVPRKIEKGILFTSFEKYEFDPSDFKGGGSFSYGEYSYKLYYADILEKGILSEPVEVVFDLNYLGTNDYGSSAVIYAINRSRGMADYCEITGELFFSMIVKRQIEVGYSQSDWAIFKGVLKDGIVTNIERLSFYKQNLSYMSPTISSDGKLLIYSICEGDSCGLYYSIRKKMDGEWSKSTYMEVFENGYSNTFPNLINDSLLVFSSDDEIGKGGLDIYKSEKINGVWNFPENWQELNSEKDDFGVEMMDEKSGYFTSGRDAETDKIYYFEIN